jgi:hypothetical protein
MKTTAQQLLAPYADYIQASYDRNDGRTTVDVALLHAQAQHIADVRNEYNKPADAWKNTLPLEDSTALGNFFKSCRTGDFDAFKAKAIAAQDKDIKATYAALLDAKSVYAPRTGSVSVTALINHIQVESYFYAE